MIKTRVDPKTGKMETVQDWSEEWAKIGVHKARKELRDMLAGNTQFHRDEFRKADDSEEST